MLANNVANLWTNSINSKIADVLADNLINEIAINIIDILANKRDS